MLAESLAIAFGVLLCIVVMLTPVLAIVALVRSRRIVRLEERLCEAERQVRMLRSAACRDRVLAVPHAEMPKPLFPSAEPWPEPAPERHVPNFPEPAFDLVPDALPDAATRSTPEIFQEPVSSRPRNRPAQVPSLTRWRAASNAWEERIGGSWLNKAGALLVVIGVSLFVGWSMVHLGPAGRVAIGLTIGGSLLGCGLVLERHQTLRVFALGLSAAGWGGLYVTTYAMHGLEAARVIDDPRTSLCLLLAVAAGMIVHANRERSPVMVAVAYAAAFAAVALGPASTFAAVACLVLAGTLLAMAVRHDWGLLAVCGLMCTYGTLAFRLPPADEGGGWGVASGFVLIWGCWLMFEAFDIAMVRLGRVHQDPSRTLLPLNLCGLLGTTALHWPPGGQGFDLFLGTAAAAYGCSTLLRIDARRRSPLPTAATAFDRAVLGGYEAAITVAAAIGAAALWTRFEAGWRLHAGLLMEAEFLFLAGLVFRQRFLRSLAAAAFSVVLIRLLAHDVMLDGTIRAWGLTFARWTPSALVTAAVLMANRVMLVPADRQPLIAAEGVSSYAATALVTLVLGGETWQGHNGLGPELVGIAWLIQAWMLLQVAVRYQAVEAYLQSCLVGFLSLVPLGMVNAFPVLVIDTVGTATSALQFWIWLLPAAAILYAAGWQLTRRTFAEAVEPAEEGVSQVCLIAASIVTLVLLWHVLPAPLVALGWSGFALLAFHAGLRTGHAGLRWHGYLALALTVGRLFLANFTNVGMTGLVSHRVLTIVPVIVLLYDVAARLADAGLRRVIGPNERRVGRLCAWAATLVLVVLLRFELGRVLAVVGWAILGLLLLVLGTKRDAVQLRWQSHAIALLSFGRSWGTHFYVPEAPDGLLQPWLLGGLVVAGLFASELLSPPDAGGPLPAAHRLLAWLDGHRRSYYCVLGTVLLAVLLVHEIPPRLLTAALGITGTTLLACGFVRPDRSLRLSGLIVMGACVPKLIFYDLRHLETPYRILSFVLLGMLLIAASWVYTRYKSRLHGYI